jgi:hypothetical protein
MAATIKIKNSSTANAKPTSSDLVQGELAINVTDKKIFTEDSGGNVIELGANFNGFKNRIINGAMVIDQRNAGASVTPSSGNYTLDRWKYQATQSSKVTIQQSTTAPSGFGFSLLVTSSSSYSVTSTDEFEITQPIEGFNTADLAWGTASAQAVTVSFWVRSSLTGTFGGAIGNNAFNRSYPISYTINAANTWEQKTVTIAGDTSGTWVGATNGIGLYLYLALGAGSTKSGTAGSWSGNYYVSATGATSVVGTNGATFYITGVQLEKGSTATSFDYRPYSTELALCQRYTLRQTLNNYVGFRDSSSSTGALQIGIIYLPMRASPSFTRISDNITLTGGTLASNSARLISTSTSFSVGTVREIVADFILDAEL